MSPIRSVLDLVSIRGFVLQALQCIGFAGGSTDRQVGLSLHLYYHLCVVSFVSSPLRSLSLFILSLLFAIHL